MRVITAVDQDKGRPRGIGYTIVSGKPMSALFDEHPERAAAGALAQGAVDYLEWHLKPALRDSPC